MPSVSGISLLSKIMSHKTCNTIPVIMMSSHDSMNIVFKCLSKGAVDFLVKPIRKNELKNLWQHVWRRCHSSSDSASESGIRTQKTLKVDNLEESDNSRGSNNDGKNSIGLNPMDGSDNGSGTQISCTKWVVEVDSPKPTLLWDQSADPPDSTFSQGIHLKLEASCKDWVSTAATECQEQQDERLLDRPLSSETLTTLSLQFLFLDNAEMGKDLEIGVPGIPDLEHDYPSEKLSTNLPGAKQDSKKDNRQLDKSLLELMSKEPIEEVTGQVADLMGSVANSNNVSEASKNISMVPEIKDKAISDAGNLTSVELSLKRLRGHGDTGFTTHENRNILRRCDLSAFSRYNTSSTASKPPTGKKVGQSEITPEAVKIESVNNFPSNSSSSPTNQQSNNNNNDMGSTTNKAFTRPADFVDKSASMSADKYSEVIFEKTDDPNQQFQVQHHHHHYHHYHHHVHNSQQKHLQSSEHRDVAQCGTLDELGRLGGSASESNHGSNGLDGSGYGVNVIGIDIESENGLPVKSGSSGKGNGSGAETNQFTREAALNKFRQKRKERCFEKKVRYQSRKMLAEQRPRIRGQFVRQTQQQISPDTDS
ncbi:hypothetical protein GIB67_030365 [Kingdonia uniflora]|uniref:Pseudo-response regulator 7 n=1 Tax=Kingdonia uniflora TaxID=39325 RepID=A0A7J7M715_9MAGN|nr:hypothetical protein GIB67_030365 [Kingdonia uniflora]